MADKTTAFVNELQGKGLALSPSRIPFAAEIRRPYRLVPRQLALVKASEHPGSGLEEDVIAWVHSASLEADRLEPPAGDCLWQLLRLLRNPSPANVLPFVQRWGVLPPEPVAFRPRPMPRGITEKMDKAEGERAVWLYHPARLYREYAQAVDAALRIGMALRSGMPGEQAPWKAVQHIEDDVTFDSTEHGELLRIPSWQLCQEPVPVQRSRLAEGVSAWLSRGGGARAEVRWDEAGESKPRITVSVDAVRQTDAPRKEASSLMTGANAYTLDTLVALEVAATLTSKDGVSVCGFCDGLFLPKKRHETRRTPVCDMTRCRDALAASHSAKQTRGAREKTASARLVLVRLLGEARLQTGLSQGEVARRWARGESVVRRIETGQTDLTVIDLAGYLRALGLGLGEFVERLERALESA